MADDSAYCRRVHARADSDAALLIGPTVRAEAIKLPSSLQANGRVDPTAGGSSYQFRAGATVSAVGMYKGFRLGSVADADCAQHQAITNAQELLEQAPDFGRLSALRDQAVFLDGRRSTWETISSKMSERFAAQAVTLLNVEDVRTRSALLMRRRAQIGGEIARIEATGVESNRGQVSQLIRSIETTSMKYEREVSHLRSLDAFDIHVTGGYVPPIFDATRSDFFGLVQVSYNLGGPWRNSAENRFLSARDEELKTARYELQRQLKLFRSHVKAALAGAKQELDIVEKNVSALKADRASIEGSDAPSAAYAQAMTDLELISSEADKVFLAGFIRELSHVEEN